jgi:uncharacterized membrane protein
MAFINIITLIIGLAGGLIVVVGLLHASSLLIKFWLYRHRHDMEAIRLDAIRLDLGRYIIVGLEFFIAKDIIESLITPSWSEIGMLAVIVSVRTLLSYFLSKELHQIETRKIEHRRIDAGI